MAEQIKSIDNIYFLQIGVQGENIANRIQIDMSSWVAQYPRASYYILFKRYNESAAYPVNTTMENGILTWVPTALDTAIVGVGFTEVRALDPETGMIKKSRIIPTVVENSVTGSEGSVAPEGFEEWLANALQSIQDAKDESVDAVETAETSALTEIDTRMETLVKKADIVDNLTSTATDKPLSAKQGKAINDMIHGAWDLIAASEWGVNDSAPGAISVTVAQKYSELMLIGYTPGAGAASDVIECRLPLSVNAFTRSATIDLDQLPSKWAVYPRAVNASDKYGAATYTPSSRVLTVQATQYLCVVCAFAR